MQLLKHSLWALCAVSCMNTASAIAGVTEDIDTIFNWAERQFPQWFANHQTTETYQFWRYRLYPSTNIIAGVNTQDNGVYVMGGPFGNNPLYFDTLTKVLAMTGQGGTVACDTTKVPPGISFTENASTVKVTSNGKCPVLPSSALCVPPAGQTGNLSVLSSNDVKSYSYQGIQFKNPALATSLAPTIKEQINVKTCMMHANQEFANRPIDVDVCFDVTETLNAKLFESPLIQSFLTVSPPVNVTFQSSILNSIVPDCFATDASIVTDALTNEVWTKKDGAFVKSQ